MTDLACSYVGSGGRAGVVGAGAVVVTLVELDSELGPASCELQPANRDPVTARATPILLISGDYSKRAPFGTLLFFERDLLGSWFSGRFEDDFFV
jgi:hypothetical protein